MSVKPIILCGGSGTRLWPESRQSLPKQFMPLFKNKSLFELTIIRILTFTEILKPIIVCSKTHSFYVKNILKKYNVKADLILEPEGRNTTAAIYFAAKICNNDDNLIIMPSDHLIKNNKQFCKDIENISKQTNFNEWITLGIKPTYPSEAYGYIKTSNFDKDNLIDVLKFIEKPTKKKAIRFLSGKNYFWNSGIFLGKASMILKSIQTYAPVIAQNCDKARLKNHKSNNGQEVTFSLESFREIPAKSIDFAVMEFEKNIKLYHLNTDWSDVGSWDAVSKIDDQNKNQHNIIEIDSNNNFIRSDNKIIATIGIKDLIIINSDDALLVAQKDQSEKVKMVVKKLTQNKISEGTEHSFENRPWGKFENLLDSSQCKVKRIEILPQRRLSLQYHKHRSEHWFVVKGEATVFLNGKQSILLSGESIDIPLGHQHYIENKTKKPLIIIETQLGTYFGEDDIIRLDDPYER